LTYYRKQLKNGIEIIINSNITLKDVGAEGKHEKEVEKEKL
jgi:hypothetical protein